MLHQLPMELYVYIMQTAAYEYRFSDRQIVVNLATSCRTVYNIVAPILYHTIIITHNNRSGLQSLATRTETQPLAERIFLHVRSVHNFGPSGELPVDPRLLANIESTNACTTDFRFPLAKLKNVQIPDVDFRRSVSDQKAPGVLRAVTHINGLLPMFKNEPSWPSFFADPVVWMQSLLDNLPAVTHLGLAYNYPWRGVGAQVIPEFDCKAIGMAVRAALRNKPSLQCLVIRSCGIFAETRRNDLETVLRDVNDPRVKVWFDMRPQENWVEHCALCISDIKEGRSLWTEASSL